LTGRRFIFPVLAALSGALAAFPDALVPWLPRDSLSHAFGIGYAWKIISGKTSAAFCKFWYTGFPYTGTYGFLPYILASPLYPKLGGYKSFSIAMIMSASIFSLSVYMLSRSLKLNRSTSLISSILTSSCMISQWIDGGIYPMTLSMALGNLSHAYYKRNYILSVALLTLSLYSHPAGGILSSATIAIRGIYENSYRKPLLIVITSLLLSSPFYIRFLYLYPTMSSLVTIPLDIGELIETSIFSPGLPLIIIGTLGSIFIVRRNMEYKQIAMTTLTCFSIAWIIALFVIICVHCGYLPFRNLLLDRITCVWTTPMLSITASIAISEMNIIGNVLILPLICICSIYPTVHGISLNYPNGPWEYIVKSWWWTARHCQGYTICSGPIVRYFKSPIDCPEFLPDIDRATGFFSQGCPYFNALIARLEWERATWWYLPYTQKTFMILTGSRYAIVLSHHVKKLMMQDGIKLQKDINGVGIFECKEASLVYKVKDPIALYDPYDNIHDVLMSYTTFLNLVPRDGYKYTFVLINDRKYLNNFNKIIIKPCSISDVKKALFLANKGKKVIIVIPNSKVINEYISNKLKVKISRGYIDFYPKSVVKTLNSEYRGLMIIKAYPMRVFHRITCYYIDNGIIKNVKTYGGTLRILGVDPVNLVKKVNPVPIVEGPNHLALPIPGKKERSLAEKALKGFECKVTPVDYTGRRDDIRIKGKGWFLIATRFTPEWIVYNGKAYPGSGGDLMVRVKGGHARVTYEPYVPWWSFLGPALGILLLVFRRP